MKLLNREGIPGPFGGKWSPSTIHGNPKRGTGILNNELCIGRVVWNHLRYVKNPNTGKRVSRLNPASEWITTDVPHLRIIRDELWSAAKQRQKHTRHAIATTGKLSSANRPRYLFSGLTKCGVCGAGFIMGSANCLCCFGARDQGTCSNKLTIRRDEVEARVLKAEWNALQKRKTALQAKLDSADEPPPLLHPGMAELYRQKVTDLARALEHPDTRTEAADAIRGLIDAIVLTPVEGALEAYVVRRGRRVQADRRAPERASD